MSEALDLFRKARRHGHIMPGDREALDLLHQAATKWREVGNHLSAGIAMMHAIFGAWGDGRQVDACAEAALRDFNYCIQNYPASSLDSLLALFKSYQELSRYVNVGEGFWAELGNRLLSHYSDSANADSFLVR